MKRLLNSNAFAILLAVLTGAGGSALLLLAGGRLWAQIPAAVLAALSVFVLGVRTSQARKISRRNRHYRSSRVYFGPDGSMRDSRAAKVPARTAAIVCLIIALIVLLLGASAAYKFPPQPYAWLADLRSAGETTTTEPVTESTEAPSTTAPVPAFKTMRLGGYEWLVLTEQGDKALIITKDCLELRDFNNVQEAVSWEDSSLRQYLNESFYKNAFSDAERKKIILTTNANAAVTFDNGSSSVGGNATQDYVFLLSYAEAEKYFTNDASRIAALQGDTSDTAIFWWLRSPGNYIDGFSCVNSLGELNYSSSSVDLSELGVRPALWVSLAENESEETEATTTAGVTYRPAATTTKAKKPANTTKPKATTTTKAASTTTKPVTTTTKPATTTTKPPANTTTAPSTTTVPTTTAPTTTQPVEDTQAEE
ncbi:MAG: DUF6273 domain-containing protein [Clostridium sp.]|nr:DUF6273 domain-containing protein [Clostridium sp.]